jgi:D-cysteine desulfhydrase
MMLPGLSLPRLSLAHVPTPLWRTERLLPGLLDLPAERLPELWVKRDDLTGAALSGNKVRKLEFLLAEAKAQGADTVITCGGAQSNHCRATALAAAHLGLSSILYLRTADPSRPPPVDGNILLDRMCGAQVRFITPAQYQQRAALLSKTVAELQRAGRRGYAIPEGGSSALGCLGYAAAVAELAAQVPDAQAELTIVHATGSGGTGAGLLLGVALLGLPWRVIGVNVCDDRDYFVGVMGAILEEAAARLSIAAAGALSAGRDRFEVLDGYVGRGYAQSRPEELRLVGEVCRRSGLVLDPVYTGKAMFGMLDRLRQDALSLGRRIVFLHTGGIFGLFDGAKTAELVPLLDEAAGP